MSSAFNAGLYKKAAAGAAVIAGAVGVAWWTQTSPGPTNTSTASCANIWVNTSAGGSPSRSSSCVTYDSTHAYGDFSSAYAAASQGDTIYVRAGAYPGQTIAYDASKTSANGRCYLGSYTSGYFPSPATSGCVTISAEPGATVTVGARTTATSNVNLNGVAYTTLTSDGTNVANADTVTLNATTYTFKATLSGCAANDVKIGATSSDSLENLAELAAGAGTPGTNYCAGSAAPTNVVAKNFPGNGNGGTSVIFWDTAGPGTGGNSYASTETSAHLSFTGATFAAGADATTRQTIAVSSTTGFNTFPGHTYYQLLLGGNGAIAQCTAKTSNSFTGCQPNVASGFSSGWLLGYDSGADVKDSSGGLVVNSGFVRIQNVTGLAEVSALASGANPKPTDVIFDHVTTNIAFSNGSYIDWTQSFWGNDNVSSPSFFTTCDNCVLYRSTVAHAIWDHCDGLNVSGQNTNSFCHGDGIFANGNTNLYVVANSFYDNDAFDLLMGHSGDPINPGPITITNNFFGLCHHFGYGGAANAGDCNALQVRAGASETMSDVTIAGNSFSTEASGGSTFTGTTGSVFNRFNVFGNLIYDITCSKPSGMTTYDVAYQYNLEAGTACANGSSPAASNNTGSVTATSLWTNPIVNGDMHLISGATPAEGIWVGCNTYLTVDIDGDSRPATCNAGADQR